MDQYACTASQFKRAFCYGIKQLSLHRERINALNILPVPNGNTGNNLHKTLLSSLQEMKDEKHLGNLAQQCARGALFGASGSSGIILANFLIGFSAIIGDKETAPPDELLRAVENGCLKAKSTMDETADGGIFEIGTAVHDELSSKHAESQTLAEFITLIYIAAGRALESALSRNDAGALGIFYFIDGLYRYSTAKPLERCKRELFVPSITEDIEPVPKPLVGSAVISSACGCVARPCRSRVTTTSSSLLASARGNDHPSRRLISGQVLSIKEVLYSVEFLLINVTVPIEEIKKSFLDIGNPILLAYEKGDTIKVLIRTADPKRVFDRSQRFGKSTRIRVDDLIDEQRYFLSKMQNKDIV